MAVATVTPRRDLQRVPIRTPIVDQSTGLMTKPWQTWFLTQFENHPIDSPVQAVSTVPNFVYSEIPAGQVNGINKLFSLSHLPSPAPSVRIYLNGVRQGPNDFTLSGQQVEFTVAPQANDWIATDYTY